MNSLSKEQIQAALNAAMRIEGDRVDRFAGALVETAKKNGVTIEELPLPQGSGAAVGRASKVMSNSPTR